MVMSNLLFKLYCNNGLKRSAGVVKQGLSNRYSTKASSFKDEEAKKLRSFILHRYVQYVKTYDQVLEKKFPAAMRVYRVFSIGIRDFYNDLKQFIKVFRIVNSSSGNLRSLTRQQIEIYHQMPKDMMKVAPVLLISALPFANYVVFPIAYIFPRQLLSSHFWSLQQRLEFKTALLRKRLVNNRPVFRCMQLQIDEVEHPELRQKLSYTLGLVGSGVQPNPEEIVQCKELFSGPPYHLLYLHTNHVKRLLRMHGLHTWLWFRRKRLADHARIILEMDKAITREGGVPNLQLETLKSACYIRGLNPINMSNEDMMKWLEQWMEVSKFVDEHSLSMLLHCPILLGYNQPTNWKLIYPFKK